LDWPEVEKFSANLQLSSELRGRYHPFPYLHERMGAALTVADLALTRAGASVLGELPAFGLPAILVPYPHAWLYQQVNARMLASRKAAIIIQDSDLPVELLPKLRALLDDQAGLERMRTAMQSLAQPEAAREIAGMILEMHTQKGSDS
jgi:UDP-N-acetylglucosamine--N-acetylmuramyl-(pentapeptide) pyrophosphoryl-undecaprenol N-acetylglucosamine transferase